VVTFAFALDGFLGHRIDFGGDEGGSAQGPGVLKKFI
jgi:hypothetical protein